MKIVINDCHGGFGLSPKALVEYYKRKGVDIYRYDSEFVQIPLDKDSIFDHFSTVNTPVITSEELNSSYISDYHIERDDPILISIVEEFGEKASGSCSELKIVEIPDDVEWEICEYDGSEWIAEKHRRWS